MATRNRRFTPKVTVLRLGHRIPRDTRITTHVCLTARALGASAVIVSDTHDKQLEETVNKVTAEFGGKFTIETGRPWRSVIHEWKRMAGVVIHLSAYGLPLPKVIDQITESKADLLVVVGAEKVPGEMFRLADWNVSITSQPISEVSALGVFLDWLFKHSRLEYDFPDGKLRIVPRAHGKKVEGL